MGNICITGVIWRRREKQNKSSNEPDVILMFGVRQRLELLNHKTTVETISPGQKHTGNKKF